MQSDKAIIDKLIEFRDRDKFSLEAWEERGLNPSPEDMCQFFTSFFNFCAENLFEIVKNQGSPKHLKELLKAGLKSLNKSHYDTEEKEFICDLLQELAITVNVDINDRLNKWLYGSALTTLTKIQKTLRPEKIIETVRQPCSKCGIQLETFILKKEDGILETSWLVAKCDNCKELNLLSHGPNVKETKFGNYQWVEMLYMGDYSYEQALTRVEQMKSFRK